MTVTESQPGALATDKLWCRPAVAVSSPSFALCDMGKGSASESRSSVIEKQQQQDR